MRSTRRTSSGFSYGFRPGRGQHDRTGTRSRWALSTGAVNWVLDADIRSFFDTISHDWMSRFLEHRVGDRRGALRLIRNWLKAGVVENGIRRPAEKSTPQGAVISPLLANIYLHYAYDLWVEQWRRRHARGRHDRGARYADDTVVGFEHRSDAERFLAELRIRMAKFAAGCTPAKHGLIEFGRQAASDRAARGAGKPETFDFLGFTHICSRSRRGGFLLARHTRRRTGKWRSSWRSRGDLRRRWHQDIAEQGDWLGGVVRGFFAYAHAVPTNARACSPAFRHYARRSSGDAPCAGVVSGIVRRGNAWKSWPSAGCPSPGHLTRGPLNASASNTQGGSRMREFRTYGSVRGALSNGRPYRDPLRQGTQVERRPPSFASSHIA